MLVKIKYYLKLILAYINRFKGIIFTGVLVGIIIFIFFGAISPFIRNRVERIGVTGRYRPEELPDYILNDLGSGLTKIDTDGQVHPGIASSWETPDNGKTWIFHLDKNAYWQDGQKVKSSEITYNFSDVLTERPDDSTIVFRLKDPFSPFPSIVNKPFFKKGLLGTGSWKVKKLRVIGNYVQELTLVKNKKDVKLYRFYPTTEGTKTAFKLGKVDKIINIYDASDFNDWPNVKNESIQNKGQIVTLFFNTQDKFFADKSIRQALTYAINKKQFGNRALSPISSDSWAFNPQVKEYAFDKDKSKEILKGLPNEVKNTKVTLISTPELINTADKIANSWKDVGVDTNVVLSPFVPNEFQVYLTILDIPNDPDQYSLWHSTEASSNISKYASPRVDKLLEEGRTQTNIEERKKTYLDFQRFLLEDLPAAFLYYPTYYTISR
jgi:peptide/nickel transport system substrate-binding protein